MENYGRYNLEKTIGKASTETAYRTGNFTYACADDNKRRYLVRDKLQENAKLRNERSI